VAVTVLTRDRHRAVTHFGGRVRAVESLFDLRAMEVPEVIVNLAGKNLGSARWNAEVKRQLVDSRVKTTQHVIDYIARADRRPQLLISGSAVGYYGARGEEVLTEEAPPADEFQSQLCREWETAARPAEDYGVRLCISRTGIVMGRGGGALAGLAPQFRQGLGASVGSGQQWISWIHMTDLLDLFLRFMTQPDLRGAFNNTAPNPVRNRDFAKAIGRALRRPVWLRVPGWVVRPAMGEMAHLYLTGQQALPARHLAAGVGYRYPDIGPAIAEALSPRRTGVT
jgi:uncharacterized protein (TIGR01777 family)